MSPLAQVSKAESLHCHKHHCPQGHHPASDNGPVECPQLATGHPLDEKSLKLVEAQEVASSEVGPGTGAGDSQAKDGGPVATVFTGCFHAYPKEVLKPSGGGGGHPFWGYFSSLKDFLEPPSTFPVAPEEMEQPQDLQSKAGPGWSGENWPVATIKACWVPPGATMPRGKRGHEEEEEEDDEEEEEAFGPSTKLRAISPLVKEADGGDTGSSLPRGHQVLAKPKAVVASPVYAASLGIPKGTMLHFPGSFGNPLEHLKTQGVPAAPSLTSNPFIIPAFPSPLVATSDFCRPLVTSPGHYYPSSPRHRLYPTWQSQHNCCSSAFHRHTKL
ncbi:ARI5A protein, partial [Turnix velox]|nr:ARI5A protein [Turnix velox]